MDTSCSQKNGPKPPQPIAAEGWNARRSFKIARNFRLGHFIFVFIHPFLDGNGRIARFLMNVMMAAVGPGP